MKWSEFTKLAKENGWIFERHGTKHDIYVHPHYEGLMQIERHGSAEIKNGLFKRLMKQVKGE